METSQILKCILLMLTVASYSDEIESYRCGTAEILESRILGGIQTKRGKWPFIAALYNVELSMFFCAATLISTKHVLTAAHCVQQKESSKKLSSEDIVVLLGKYNLMRIEKGVVQTEVDEIFIHPDWKAFNQKYDADIAIFSLTNIIDFSNTIRPICLPEFDELIDDREATIVGWGIAEHTKPNSHELIPRETTTWALNASYCSSISPQLAAFASTRAFCGGGDGGSPNMGDSGGGLFVRSGFAWVQYGIISSSLSDGFGRRPNSMSLYTSIVAHKNWITDTVKQSGSAISTTSDHQIENIEISCGYSIVLVVIYKCSIYTANVPKQNMRVTSFVGEHLEGYSAQNVSEIWYWIGTLNYIPDGIGKLFTNLEKFWVSFDDRNLHLKLLQRRNFQDMPSLWYIDVKFNDIEWVDEDSLRDLPNLKHFIIKSNKLKKLGKLTFAKNPKLILVNGDSNELEDLHKDLFNKNPLLESVSFKDNKLLTISLDFTKFLQLNDIEFRGNTCIDKALKMADGFNVIEYQALLNSSCRNVTKYGRTGLKLD